MAQKTADNLLVAVGVLQQDAHARNEQVQQLIAKVEKSQEKTQELHLIMTQILTKHETQIASLTDQSTDQRDQLTTLKQAMADSAATVGHEIRDTMRVFVDELKAEMTTIKNTLQTHDSRLNKIERVHWLIGGLGTLVGLAIPSVISFVLKLFL